MRTSNVIRKDGQGWLMRYLHAKFWNWTLLGVLAHASVQSARHEILHDLCSRIPIEKMEENLQKAKGSGEKYVTLARLLANDIWG